VPCRGAWQEVCQVVPGLTRHTVEEMIMTTPSVRLFLVSVAIVAMAPFVSTQTVTLGFDGAPEGPLPWSEQGFTFTETENGVASVQADETLLAAAYSSQGNYAETRVRLAREDGGTFDALSLDVVGILFDDTGCEETSVSVTSARGTVDVFEAGTIVLEWTDITELTVEVSGAAAFFPEPWIGFCILEVVLDNFVVNVPETECLLVVGDGPGAATHFDGDMDHLFETQLDGVEDAHAVLIEEIPEFVLPVQPGRRHVMPAAPLGNGTIAATPVGDVPLDQPPTWMLDGDFAVQVLMWNPQDFPAQPEQYTAGLYVSIQPDGSVVTTPYGTDQGGMEVWHEVDTNAAGQRVIRFLHRYRHPAQREQRTSSHRRHPGEPPSALRCHLGISSPICVSSLLN
jgi:hypothetical protein